MTEMRENRVMIAIDMTEADGVVSLVRGKSEVAFAYLQNGRELESLPQVCLKILKNGNYRMEDIEAFAVSEQSYSLTRGRIVKSLIRGLADGFDKPFFELNLFKVLWESFYPSKGGKILFGYLFEPDKIQFKFFDKSTELFDKTLGEDISVEQLFENNFGEKLDELKVKTIISSKLASYIRIDGDLSRRFPAKVEILEPSLGALLGFRGNKIFNKAK